MEEGVGFEPTDPCGSTVFKTVAITQTLPPFHWWLLLDSDQGRARLQRTALPTELRSHKWWNLMDLNHRPTPYEGAALHQTELRFHRKKIKLSMYKRGVFSGSAPKPIQLKKLLLFCS